MPPSHGGTGRGGGGGLGVKKKKRNKHGRKDERGGGRGRDVVSPPLSFPPVKLEWSTRVVGGERSARGGSSPV